MKKFLYHKLWRQEEGATAVEFAMLAPALILFTFGILEFTIGLGAYLQASEAVRAAARVAAIQPAIADLGGLEEGATASCTSQANLSCGAYTVNNAGSYDAVLTEAQRVLSDITAQQLSVSYSSSGMGFSTTAAGTAPLVTVRLNGYEHNLVLQNLIPGVSAITFPDFATSRMIAY